MTDSLKSGKSSDKKLTYYIIIGWAIVVVGILVFYSTYQHVKNEFWSFNNPNKQSTLVIRDDAHKLTGTQLNELYQSLSQIQNLEQSTILHTNKLTLEEIKNNNCLFIGAWNNLGLFKEIIPDSLVLYDDSKRILHWKHDQGFYDLPLTNHQESMTYAIAAKMQTSKNHQSTLIIQFDEINQAQFLQYLWKPATIETLKHKLNISDRSPSFIALFKIPKKYAINGEIEWLDGFLLQP